MKVTLEFDGVEEYDSAIRAMRVNDYLVATENFHHYLRDRIKHGGIVTDEARDVLQDLMDFFNSEFRDLF